MYDELIKRLRNRRICIQQSGSLDDFPMLREAADAIEELQAAVDGLTVQTNMVFEETEGRTVIKFEPKWIPVTERLPEKDQTVLAYCAEDNFCYISRMHQSFEDYDVTHWIPLPHMPKDGES